MKIIGLDVGTKRIGVARADSSVRIAVPQCTISVDGTEFEQISRISRVYDAECFVIGLPRNSEGMETDQSRYSRDFAKKLKKTLPKAKICFQDESLTSVEAEKNLKNRKKGFKKGDIDSEAAAIILQDFLENIAKNKGLESKTSEKSKRHISKNKLLISLAIICACAVMGFLGFCLYNGSLEPVAVGVDCSAEELIESNPDACKKHSVIIDEGMSVANIASALKDRDLIQNAFTFQVYSRIHGVSSSMKTGRYDLDKTMSVKDIVDMLVDGSAGVVTFRLTTLPGGTIADFRETLFNNGYSEQEIETALAAKYDNPVLASKPEDASLEGYLYGETIEFSSGDSVESIIDAILNEFYAVVISNKLEEKFAAQGFSLHEGIILASIIQKEVKNSDMPAVAKVFYNRLAEGMTLGSDATVTYALNQIDPDRKIYADNSAALDIESCYNTRVNAGLPCGPVSNPGLAALRAVANPEDNSYLYFLTGDDGIVYYSNTDDGHNQNIRDHCQTLCNISL